MTTLRTEHDVIEKIKEIVLSTFDMDLSKVPSDAPIADAGLDSMAMLDVIIGLEDAVGHKFNDVSLPRAPTLQDVAQMVLRNVESV
ncbi:acyl carrier protein [Thiomonas intermedia]|uniref:acyl carrier protein n=1 Tax=Thiomonas intermedia TaxID=926 RepID=UPI0009A4B877|nr:acyl carrier protein [Thiomonas intermedia]